MNNDQQSLVQLLSIAIHRKRINNNEIDKINWNKVFELAKEQDIHPLLYPVIKDINDKFKLPNEIMVEWKKATVLASLIQVQSINKIKSLLVAFNEAEMQVMGLKGLVLRELYPVKELRTMGDIDILIHIEDLEKAEKILLNLGYFEDHRDLKHIFFMHKQNLPIELHWKLFNQKVSEDFDYIERIIWENPVKINVSGATVVTPSLENQILHLCAHMAWHFKYSGFGLRQLCDLVILVEAKGHKVNWNSFYEKVERCKLDNFVIAIFEVCRRIFQMHVPTVLSSSELDNIEYIDMLVDNVFAGGVHGGIYGSSSLGPADDNLLTYYKSNKQYGNVIERIKYMVRYLFPSRQRLGKRYSYAKENSMFIPVAWLHRFIYGIFRGDFNLQQKRFLLLSQSDFYRKRADLFKWLEL